MGSAKQAEQIQRLREDLDRARARAEKWRSIARTNRLRLRELKKKRSKEPSRPSPRKPRPPSRSLVVRLRRDNAQLHRDVEKLRSQLQSTKAPDNRTSTIGHMLLGAAVPLLLVKAWLLCACVAGVGLAIRASQ